MMTPLLPSSALFLNGTVGVGKSTTAEAAAQALAAVGVPGAWIDLDAIRQVWPAPADDSFQHRLTLDILASWARSALAAGAQRIVVAGSNLRTCARTMPRPCGQPGLALASGVRAGGGYWIALGPKTWK
jgi:adenylylsulfate kinase-like enzyme